MKIGDQRLLRTLKDQMVRRVLNDNKVPGTSAGSSWGTRVAEAPPQGRRICCRILGRE